MNKRYLTILCLSVLALLYLLVPTNNGGTAGQSSQTAGNHFAIDITSLLNPAEAFSDSAIYVLEARPAVEMSRVVPAGMLPADAYINRQWYVYNDGSFKLAPSKQNADIQLAEAWQVTSGDSNIIVAVLDGGLDFSNSEFDGRIWRNSNEIPGNGIDDDNNGYVDDVQGWDFVDNDNLPEDEAGHGTNVAGIIGADANNGSGYAGIDWNCKLMPLKVADKEGVGRYRDWAKAIRYAVDHGARVINMSVGGTTKSPLLQDAVNYAYERGVVIVASMMNTNTETPYYPAACEHVIAVGATNPDDTRAVPFFWSRNSGSNYGGHITVVAPGNFIYGLSMNGNNMYWGGTSQAAPVVSGIVSLLLAQDPGRTPDDIKQILTATADDQVGTLQEDTQGWDKFYGFGRVNAFKALQYKFQAQAQLSN